MPETACQGPCNFRARQAHEAFKQALAAYDPMDPQQSRPQPPEVTFIGGNPWCPRCQSAIRLELAELDELAALVVAFADGHRTGPGGERVAGTQGHRSPSPALDAVDELCDVMLNWEASFRGGNAPARRGHLTDILTATITWSVAHFDAMITHPDIGLDFGQEIRQWHRALKGRSKAGTAVRHKPLRCPGASCGQLSLTWREGDTYVRCNNPGCQRMMTLAEYEAYADAFAKLPAAS